MFLSFRVCINLFVGILSILFLYEPNSFDGRFLSGSRHIRIVSSENFLYERKKKQQTHWSNKNNTLPMKNWNVVWRAHTFPCCFFSPLAAVNWFFFRWTSTKKIDHPFLSSSCRVFNVHVPFFFVFLIWGKFQFVLIVACTQRVRDGHSTDDNEVIVAVLHRIGSIWPEDKINERIINAYGCIFRKRVITIFG